ncbi:MAG: class I adenylate-forming enzyme family protein, partial [Candidatus Thorarchaeota archaeon]
HWFPMLDFENESPYIENPNRPWLKFRAEYTPKSIRFDPIPVPDYIKRVVSHYPNNVCVYHKPADKKYTYREMIYTSNRIANALLELGIKNGDAVAIITENCPEFLFCFLGILETGASIVPINPLLKEKEVLHIIRDAGNIKIIFVHKNNFRTIKKVASAVDLKNIILLQSEEPKPNTLTFEEFIRDKSTIPPIVEIDPTNDVAALLYTGGTTGLPKGVILTHNNLVADALSTLYTMRTSAHEEDVPFGERVVLTILPLCHSFGFQISILSLVLASMLVIFKSFNPSEVLEAIEYYRVTHFNAVPVMYQMIVNSPDFTKRDLSSLEVANSGTAALAPELNKKWEEVVGFKVGQGFGLTETSPITHMAAHWMPEIKSASIGVPIIDTDAKIVNPETLEELPVGEIGELLVRGPQVMKGYWKDPKATSATLINNWLRTGDLARMDEQGYFYIEGRTKDMIKYKGYKVMPREVEEVLYEHPAILEAAVVSAPDPNIGETIKAYIALKPDYKGKIAEQEIIDWSKEKMAAYKYPRQVEFITILPRTSVGKIFRRKLRERAARDN